MTNRFVLVVLAPLVVGYLGWLSQHAWFELNEDYRIEGLFRSYQPPHTLPDGTRVIDPRPGPLPDELVRRYAPTARPGPAPTRPADWAAWAQRAGLEPRATRARAPWAGVPRLVFRPSGPELVIRQFDASARSGTGWQRAPRTEYAVFQPAHGVSLRVELSPEDGPAFDLHGAREAPW